MIKRCEETENVKNSAVPGRPILKRPIYQKNWMLQNSLLKIQISLSVKQLSNNIKLIQFLRKIFKQIKFYPYKIHLV